jgi:hypothetical protein
MAMSNEANIEKAAEAIVEKSHEHCATWITIEEARELARAALPHLQRWEEPTEDEAKEILRKAFGYSASHWTDWQPASYLRNTLAALSDVFRRRNAPPEPQSDKGMTEGDAAVHDLVQESYRGLTQMTIGEAVDEWYERIRTVALTAYMRGLKCPEFRPASPPEPDPRR